MVWGDKDPEWCVMYCEVCKKNVSSWIGQESSAMRRVFLDLGRAW